MSTKTRGARRNVVTRAAGSEGAERAAMSRDRAGGEVELRVLVAINLAMVMRIVMCLVEEAEGAAEAVAMKV